MIVQGRKLGIRDVAQRAGVSVSSVSRVLDNHPDVSDVMRNRVMDAVAALGYEPDPVAQSMRTGTTMTIGLVAGDTSNPLIAQISLAAELKLREWGYSLLVANSINDPTQELANIKLLLNRRVDGLLLSVSDEASEKLREQLESAAVPVVLLDREIRNIKISRVNSDHDRGITQAAEELLRLGHSRVALINGNPRVRPSRERANALRKAFRAEAGSGVNVVSGSFSDRHGYEAALALLQRANRPTAIIAGSNQILVGVLRAIRFLGLHVPDDLSLITCDQTPLAELHEPPIATIRRDASEIGVAAAELLRAAMQGGAAEQRNLPTRFEPAGSCTTPIGIESHER